MAADGKDYVYDITKISKLKNGPHNRQATSNSAYDSSGIHNNKISSDGKNVNKKYSINIDNMDNELSEEQQEFFKDSKVRDENGQLMVMYHGTPYGDFTVFKNELNYFTPNKEYGDRYQEPSASSVRGYYKDATNKKTYAVYLNIEKPFDISDKKTMDIFINEYVKGGYAAGINPYISESEIRKQVKNGIDWTEADNLKEFIEDMEYDYDGLILDEGGDGGYGDSVTNRGKSYVTFYPRVGMARECFFSLLETLSLISRCMEYLGKRFFHLS